MTCGASLFERLGNTADTRTGLSREARLMASVAAHLSRMLSTRAGSVHMLPDYGLPDVNDMRLSLHDTLRHAQKSIEHFIGTYEPRLSNVRVVAEPDHDNVLMFMFSIKAFLEVDGANKEVVFYGALDGRGSVNVRSH
ncbi:type VI secretion system baseplate subunit TssE [Pseudomonas triticifolii]|uniref:Type VI secretion system baseplate subunit TssE n=1 Tax=Pseudomonas triticifolii TaxID=2762592 RepID=A0ABR7B9U1_9PSED|nr:type VI secretion system baseplate subunit TssE [Pseudomonas triticifolii]MBC3953954.1 type VI secretion system baseplate subunit TssE [Pseudomonas triticifolii]